MSHCPLCLPKAKSQFGHCFACDVIFQVFCSILQYLDYSGWLQSLPASPQCAENIVSKHQASHQHHSTKAKHPIPALPAELLNCSRQDIKPQNKELTYDFVHAPPAEEGQLSLSGWPTCKAPWLQLLLIWRSLGKGSTSVQDIAALQEPDPNLGRTTPKREKLQWANS